MNSPRFYVIESPNEDHIGGASYFIYDRTVDSGVDDGIEGDVAEGESWYRQREDAEARASELNMISI